MRKIVVFMILLLVLSSCGNDGRYNFSGSTENWDVLYEVDVTLDIPQKETGTFRFTGKGGVPQTIDYMLETSSSRKEETGIPIRDGAANFGEGECGICLRYQKDEKIEVTIVWNGQTESVVLINEQ